jgi:hypothetical protein
MKIDYTNLSFTELIDKIEANRFFDLPRMVREAFKRLLTRVEALEAPKYKVYTALLSQSGTDAPIATVLENTLGGTVVWSYEDVGDYRGTLNEVFTENKTHLVFTNNSFSLGAYPSYYSFDRVSENYVQINTTDGLGGIGTNDNLYYTSIEIRVYN